MPTVRDVEPNWRRARSAMASAAESAGRDARAITLIAVVKEVTVALAAAVHAAGATHLAHNRVADAADMRAALGPLVPAPTWHMIGHLQRNKVRAAVATFDTIDTLDSVRLAVALNQAAADAGRIMPVLIEVNISGESAKHGVAPNELDELVAAVADCPALRLEGLMGMGPLTPERHRTQVAFEQLAALRTALSAELAQPLPRLSMGMSGDFDLAIAAGATEVRLGRVLFEP